MTTLVKLKDEDGGGELDTLSEVRIEVLDRGYILTIELGEGEIKEAYTSRLELLARIGDLL